MNTVQRVELKDYKRAAQTLADAFCEDPVTLYFCRHPHTLSKDQVQQRNEYILSSIVKFNVPCRDMMDYITYAHILNGLVYQIGDFGAVALWFIPIDKNRINCTGCHLVKTWMTCLPSSRVVCGDCSTNSPTKVENVSSTNSCLVSMIQSTTSSPPRTFTCD